MEYFVITNVKFQKRTYTRGSVINVDGVIAEQLLASGAISQDEPTVAASAAPTVASKPTSAPSEPRRKSGEPSIDGPEDGGTRKEAEDITPVVDNSPETVEDTRVAVSDAMKRDDLEAIALAEGLTQESIDAESTKSSLVSLIEANRNPSPADVSAGL